jgi:hypothetical protein
VTVNHALLDLLARQDGLVTIDQAQRYGLPARTLRRRVSVDGWARVAPRVAGRWAPVERPGPGPRGRALGR